MITKNKNIKENKNDPSINHFISIPEKIQNEINTKWFFLYNWIWSNDVKHSIERDFLKAIWSWTWQFLSWVFVLISALILYWNESLFYSFFFLWLLIISIIFIIYLSALTIIRSNILRKNAYVLITNSYSSIDWKIENLEWGKIKLSQKQKDIETLFEESIFSESNLWNTKSSLFKEVINKLWSWYKYIFKIWNWRSKNSGQIILILIAIYSAYVLSIWFIYIIWIFFVWIFGIFISIINKQILIITWHKITKINDNFENIDKSSKQLIKEKEELSILLKNAWENNWVDNLLSNINLKIKHINKNANISVETSIKLKREIQNSKYSKMFNFSIYNSWIKNQILIPLEQIKDLLQKNLDNLILNNEKLEIQIINTNDESMKWPLILTKQRSIMRIEELKNNIVFIQEYINKLIPRNEK